MNNKILKVLLLITSIFSIASCGQEKKEEDKMYQIQYLNDDYVNFDGATEIKSGSTLVCKIKYISETDHDYINMKIIVNDKEVSHTYNSFTVENVQSNLKIWQEGATFIQYTVSFDNNEKVSFTGDQSVNRNSDYTFKVNKLDTEIYDYSAMKVLVNDEEVNPINDVYTVNKVIKNLTIKATGITSNYVGVTFVQTTNFRFDGDLLTKKNSQYTFTLTKLNQYITDESIEVSVNGEVVESTNNVYVVDVLSSDLYIEVTDYVISDPTEGDDENKGDNPIEDLD